MSQFPKQFIGLGASCQTAYQIRRHTRNEQAHFFDWVISNDLRSIDLILNCFESDQFLTANCSIIKDGLRVLCPWSGLAFQHDFPAVDGAISDSFRDLLGKVKEKYIFLRERTCTAMTQDCSVYIRLERTAVCGFAECGRFRDIISPLSGDNPLYVLVSECVAKTMVVEDMMVFKLEPYEGKPEYKWKGNDGSWDQLFDRAIQYFQSQR